MYTEISQLLGGRRNIIKFLWDKFVHDGHLIALGDTLGLYAISLMLDMIAPISFFVVVYVSVFAINYYNRYSDRESDKVTNSVRYEAVKKYFNLTPVFVIGIFMASFIITLLSASIGALIFMAFLFFLGLLYSFLLKSLTRNIIGFKNFMTALPYGLLVIFLCIYANEPIKLAAILVSIFYFLRMFINTAFSDIKDVKSDKKDGLKTFAITFGCKNTIIFLHLLNIISIIPIVISVVCGIIPAYSLSILVTIIYDFAYLVLWVFFKKNMSSYNIFVDGEPIFWPIYIILFRFMAG